MALRAKTVLVSSTLSCAGAVTGASAPAAPRSVQTSFFSVRMATPRKLKEGKTREDDYGTSFPEGIEMHAGPGQGGIGNVLPPTEDSFCAGGFSPLLV